MSGLNYKKLGSTLSNICNTTQLDDATKCHYAFKNFWGEPRHGSIWYHLTHNHLRSYAHIHCDQVWCLLVYICRCKRVNKVECSNVSQFKWK